MEINLQRTALLTIYVQEHFMQMFATGGMVERMAEVQDAARQAGMLLVHPRGPSHDEGFPAVGPLANPHEHSVKRFGFRFGAMPEGIQGWETTPKLAPQAGEIVMPAYHSGPFVGTWLDAALRSRDIRTLVCMGLTANGAAGKNIVTDATNRGYEVVVLKDCLPDSNVDQPWVHRVLMEKVLPQVSEVMTAREFLAALGEAAEAASATRT